MLYNKNEEYLINEIMRQNRHQFIYSYNDDKRKYFLQQLVHSYPVKIDCNLPMCIYINEVGLPKVSMTDNKLDNNKISILSREYLSFSIAHAILKKSKDSVDMDLLNTRLIKLLDLLNKYNVNSGYKKIESLDELILTLAETKEFYKSYYLDYVRTGKEDMSINDIAMPFLQLEFFVSQYKRVLNNKSYFGIIIDKSEDISLASTKNVNFLVGSRINSDISMKIVVEPGKWDSYVDSNDQYVEAVHDYGIIELDDSQAEYVKLLKRF